MILRICNEIIFFNSRIGKKKWKISADSHINRSEEWTHQSKIIEQAQPEAMTQTTRCKIFRCIYSVESGTICLPETISRRSLVAVIFKCAISTHLKYWLTHNAHITILSEVSPSRNDNQYAVSFQWWWPMVRCICLTNLNSLRLYLGVSVKSLPHEQSARTNNKYLYECCKCTF